MRVQNLSTLGGGDLCHAECLEKIYTLAYLSSMKSYGQGKNNPNYKHGGTMNHKGAYNSWRAMKARCDYKNYRAYERYGGRGITYCDEWKDFASFLADMGDRPPKHSLDRIDNDGNYCKENCRWANHNLQMNNSSRVKNALVTKAMLSDAKCSMSSVYERIRKGWSVEDALNTPPISPQEARRNAALAKRRKCLVCGKVCKHKKCIYCSVECFRTTRNSRGLFTKGGDEYGKEEKAQTEASAIPQI